MVFFIKELFIQTQLPFHLGLMGELSAGKTFFLRTLLQELWGGVPSNFSSPTFSYCNIYKKEKLVCYHFDLYRITEKEKIHEIGLWETLNSHTFSVIEWVNSFESVAHHCPYLLHIIIQQKTRVYLCYGNKK